jgi:hypothetical protein
MILEKAVQTQITPPKQINLKKAVETQTTQIAADRIYSCNHRVGERQRAAKSLYSIGVYLRNLRQTRLLGQLPCRANVAGSG